MAIFRHVFAIVFIIILLLNITVMIYKQVLHFKLLKELYPNNLSKINSYFNPLAIFYLFGLNVSILLWFSMPIFYKKKDVIINDVNGITREKALIANNKRIYFSFLLLVIWLLIGIILFR